MLHINTIHDIPARVKSGLMFADDMLASTVTGPSALLDRVENPIIPDTSNMESICCST